MEVNAICQKIDDQCRFRGVRTYLVVPHCINPAPNPPKSNLPDGVSVGALVGSGVILFLWFACENETMLPFKSIDDDDDVQRSLRSKCEPQT